MPPIGRILRAFGAAVAALVYVWFAAVRALPLVKRRKAIRNIGPRGRAWHASGRDRGAGTPPAAD